jgi:hypothetical protein
VPTSVPDSTTHTHTHTYQRDKLIAHISKEENWPIRKSDLVRKYLKQLIYFTNSIDFEKM